MSNGATALHDRLFKLWAKVAMMCVDGTRSVRYVYGVLTGRRGGVGLKPPQGKSWGQLLNEFIALTVQESSTRLEPALAALQEILEGPKPVFVEFVMSDNDVLPNGKIYFVGSSLADILADTESGTAFGFRTFKAHRAVSEADVRSLVWPKERSSDFVDRAIDEVRKGCWSFYLGAPEQN